MPSRALDQEVLSILRACEVADTRIRLPDTQFERGVYVKVKAALEALGGQWVRKAQGFVFPADPTVPLAEVCASGRVTRWQEPLQQFYTPPALASQVVARCGILPGERVLEPSAGPGHLVNAVLGIPGFAQHPASLVRAVEIERDVALVLQHRALPRVEVRHADFLTLMPKELGLFDAIVMNPPFSQGAEVTHVTHALRFLHPGGHLTAIMSNAITFRQDAGYGTLRATLAATGATIEPLPPQSFRASGTEVHTVLVDLTLEIPLESPLWRRDGPAGQAGSPIQGQLSLF
jgi:hypothetical protein